MLQNGVTALIIAFQNDQIAMVAHLLACGANPDIRDDVSMMLSAKPYTHSLI